MPDSLEVLHADQRKGNNLIINELEVQVTIHSKSKSYLTIAIIWCSLVLLFIGVFSLLTSRLSSKRMGEGNISFFSTLTQNGKFISTFGFSGEINKNLLIVKPKESFFGKEDQYIVFMVMNQTGEPVIFPDQSYSVRAFGYDNIDKRWIEIELGKYPLSEPYKLLEFSGDDVDLFTTAYSIPKNRIEINSYDFVRLYISGRGESGKIYQAFEDYSFSIR